MVMSKTMKHACPFTDEIVSYMYGEIGGTAELQFEAHLAACMVCTDEFAEASNARFSVYEWKKEIFDPLPTPRITVPYGENRAPSVISAAVEAIRTWADGLSVPLAVAAALAVFIGAGVVLYSYVGNRERQFAASPAVPDVQVPQAPIPEAPTVTAADTPSAPLPTAPSSRPWRATRYVPKNVSRPVRTYAIDRGPAPQNKKAPVLTAYQETEDNSLRLADLFDEAGG